MLDQTFVCVPEYTCKQTDVPLLLFDIVKEVFSMNRLFRIVVMITMIFVVNSIVNTTTLEMDLQNIKTVQVDAGDTLWSISQKALEHTEDIDIREYIVAIEEINHLQHGTALRAGETLMIPTLKEKTMFGFITAWANN